MASAVLFVVWALGGCSVLRKPSPKPATAYPRCPEATRWVTGNVTGTQGASSSAGSNETWNLTGFTHTTTPDPTRYPFRLEGVRNVCIVGGRIIGNIPDTYSRTQWYDGIGIPSSAPKYDGDAFRIVQKNGWALIRDAYVERVSDAYNPQGPRTARIYLDHVHAKYIRDDCIENDLKPHSIYVNDSLFDGCFNFISERGEDSSYASRGRTPGETVIDNSLVYVEPMPLGPKYCDDNDRCVNDRGARGLFKWSRTATRNLVVRNTILRLDQRSYSSENGDKFPKGTYQDVTLVWLGSGDYPEALPPGVRLTRDKRVWDDAKAAWLKRAAPSHRH